MTTTTESAIHQLDDATAVRILRAVVAPRLRGAPAIPPVAELRAALVAEFGEADVVAESDGDVARSALLVLGADPGLAVALEALIAGPAPDRFVSGADVAILVCAIAVLQTHMLIERTPQGKWHLKLEKPTLKDAILTPFVRKLLALLAK